MTHTKFICVFVKQMVLQAVSYMQDNWQITVATNLTPYMLASQEQRSVVPD